MLQLRQAPGKAAAWALSRCEAANCTRNQALRWELGELILAEKSPQIVMTVTGSDQLLG